MKTNFIVRYYPVVVDDIITNKFQAETIKEAYNIARKNRPDCCEEDFDLFVDCLTLNSVIADDGFGNDVDISGWDIDEEVNNQ